MLPARKQESEDSARGRRQAGYNHNFSYQNRIFHVQTEDYGSPRNFICSHVFIDGRVVVSTKRQYSEDLDPERDAQEIRDMMARSHRKMFARIKAGEFDRSVEDGTHIPSGQTASDAEPAEDAALEASQDAHINVSDTASRIGEIAANAVARADFEAVVLPDSAETCIDEMCQRVQGLMALAYIDPSAQRYYAMRGMGLELNPALKAIVDLSQAQLDSIAHLEGEATTFEMIGQTTNYYLILQQVLPHALLCVVLDRSRANLAMARHTLEPLVQTLGTRTPAE